MGSCREASVKQRSAEEQAPAAGRGLSRSLASASKLHAGDMQICGSELIRHMHELRQKRDELRQELQQEEQEKASIQKDLLTLTRRLAEIDESLVRRHSYRSEYEKTIEEVEAAYSIIMESSQTLLNVLKLEAAEVLKKT